MVYVPPALEEKARVWVGSYREAAALWERMLEEYLERFLKEKATEQAPSPVRRQRSAP
jgi:hypothetical protein